MREISAGIIIYRKTKDPEADVSHRYGAGGLKFLILYHSRGYWNFPKGKIQSEEKSLQAAIREVREETGINSTELKIINGFKTYEKFYFWKRAVNRNVKVFKIIILYLAETRQKKVILPDIKDEGREPHEGYAWLNYHEALKVLSKHKNSQRTLMQAANFLKHQQQK